MAMIFIHDAEYFSRKEILQRAKRHEYPNPLAVELFLWDCELAAQLQNVSDDIVLKGGAAAQLHLPLEKQRGSVDIDIATPLKKDDVAQTVQKASKLLKGFIVFRLHEPKRPVPDLPLVTFFADAPSKIDSKKDKLEIKIDFLCECPNLSSLVLDDVQTFAVRVKRMKCYTAGTLIGDKLLTLAKESVGMKLEADYPKQIYDIDALLESYAVSKTLVSDILASVKVLTKLEASFRDINITPIDALRDIMKTMNEYSQIDTSGGDVNIKKNIEGFQQFLVNKNQRKPYYKWSSRCLRIRFFASLISKTLQGELSKLDAVKKINECQNTALELRQFSGNTLNELRRKILNLAQTKIPYFKELKGKPLERVFWQIVTLENLQDIERLIKNG